MSRIVELLCSRRMPQVAVLALMSIGFAGCSGDMQTRLSQDSLSNPFASEATGTAPPAPIERREPPRYPRPQPQPQYQYQSQALPPPIAVPQSNPTASAGVSGGGRGLASYAPPARPPLETTGTVAPFIGLFGTVWGIMDAFQGIGFTGSASLAAVAPGISEALVTTAAGLFAAIPAVVGYNLLLARARRLGARIDRFVPQFLALAESQIDSGRPAAAAAEGGKFRL